MTGSQPAGSPPQWTYGLDLTVQGVQSAVANIAMPGVHWHVRAAQALFWICTFDEQFHQVPGYDKARDDDPDGRVIKGLRFARNAVVHGVTPLADIRPEDGAVIKGNGWTSVSGRLRWRASSDISGDWPGMKDWNAKLITVYDEMVDGRLLEMPIEIAYRWVRTWTRQAFGQELAEARSLF